MSIISAGTSNTTTLVYTGDTTGAMVFQTNGTTEAMRIDTSGNVGIGETSPAGSVNYKQLVIRGTSGAELSLKGGSTQYGYVYVDNGGFRIINPQSGSASGTLQFHTSNTERMRISSTGTVAINSTPQTWYASETALQIGYGACFAGRTNQFDEVNIYSNAYTTAAGGTAYIGSETATYYQMSGGLHRWFNATSGSAGAPCSFTERMRITSDGNVLIGRSSFSSSSNGIQFGNNSNSRMLCTNNADYNIELFGSAGARIGFGASNSDTRVGSIQVSTTNTTYSTSSDYRLKENISPMTGALAKVQQLKPCNWIWKADGSDGQGFIAHELAEVLPDAVNGEKDAVDAEGKPVYQGVDTSFLVATLTAAIQELKAELDATKAEVAALKGNN